MELLMSDISAQSPGGRQSGPLELNIVSDPANLRPVRLAVEQYARANGMGPIDSDSVGLVVNEAIANVIRHQYGGDRGRPIQVLAEDAGGALRISIRDWGQPFDPEKLPRKAPDPSRPGGLGLLCMRNLMDEVTYTRLSDGMLLTLVKRHV
jgi:anti-sigma regulatory factor (Ser/Thr protein kinase)